MNKVKRFVFHQLNPDHWSYDVPGDNLHIEFGEMDTDHNRPLFVANTSNDGFELWIGYHNKWLWHCRAEDARQLAWFIIWHWWIAATWCGLKRKIWYWSL